MTGFDQCLNLVLTDRTYLPDRPGIYVIYVSPDIALYIGASISIKNRIKAHVATVKGIPCVRVAWFPLPVQFHKQTERHLIQVYNPALNDHHVRDRSKRVFGEASLREFVKRRQAERLLRGGTGEN